MSVLLLAEINNGALVLDSTARTVSASKALGDITILCAGHGAEEAATQAATIEGVSTVLVANDDALANRLAEPMAALLASLADPFEHIVAAATSDAKNILPRLAALLDVMIIPDIVSILDGNTFERPIYAGNALQTVTTSDEKKILTIRTSSFDAAGTAGAVEIKSVQSEALPNLSAWVKDELVVSERPDLGAAKIVVSGGRGVGSEENFGVISQLADKMGAAIGASRAAVDAGFAANDLQVGQTGKVVAPDLYIAAGISGAIQHLAGMKDSKYIVAINKDPEAPIFQVADFGLVADLHEALPELTEKV